MGTYHGRSLHLERYKKANNPVASLFKKLDQ